MNTRTTALQATFVAGLAIASTAQAQQLPAPLVDGAHAASRVRQIDLGTGTSLDTGFVGESVMAGPAASGANRDLDGLNASVMNESNYGWLSANTTFNGQLSAPTTAARFVQGFGGAAFMDDSLVLTGSSSETVTLTAEFALDVIPQMDFSAPLQGDGFAYQEFTYTFSLEIAGTTVSYSGVYHNDGTGTVLDSGDASPGVVSVDVEVPVGESFNLSAQLDTFQIAAVSDLTTSVDFSSAAEGGNFRWLGFTNAPQGVELDSDFGNYGLSVVPTPASGALAAVGLMVAGARRRR